MSASAIVAAVYAAVAAVFIGAFLVEGVMGARITRKVAVAVIAAGLLWPLTVITAFVLAVLEAARREKT